MGTSLIFYDHDRFTNRSTCRNRHRSERHWLEKRIGSADHPRHRLLWRPPVETDPAAIQIHVDYEHYVLDLEVIIIIIITS